MFVRLIAPGPAIPCGGSAASRPPAAGASAPPSYSRTRPAPAGARVAAPPPGGRDHRPGESVRRGADEPAPSGRTDRAVDRREPDGPPRVDPKRGRPARARTGHGTRVRG